MNTSGTLDMTDEVIARITVSPPRRYLAVGVQLALGALLLYLVLAQPPASVFGTAFLLGVSGLSFWGAVGLWQATGLEIELTREGLRDTSGEVLAHIDDVSAVNRGMLAAKPSNGFSIVLKSSGQAAWRPGLWWRLGKRVAVGGVTSGHQTRPVADILSAMIVERDAQ